MAKKLSDLRHLIDQSGPSFVRYLQRNLNEEVMAKIHAIANHTDIYFFSGLIRNYFLKVDLVRDVDIVLGDVIDLKRVFSGDLMSKNSFGGHRITVGDTKIDLWYIGDTWAFQKEMRLNPGRPEELAGTAFFNFSAIVFSLKECKFYYNIHFLRFLRDKKINVAYHPNANYSLCIINSLYYSDTYHLKIANELMRYLKILYRQVPKDFTSTQLKHFGRVIYSNKEVRKRLGLDL